MSTNPAPFPDHVTIPARRVPVLAEAEVAVCGGGVSGVTAAVSAARAGCRVVLLERWPACRA